MIENTMIEKQNNKTNKFIFIYNLIQAEFYFNKGIAPYRVGLSSQKNVFVQFLKTDELTNAFTDWCNRKMQIHNDYERNNTIERNKFNQRFRL